MLIRPLIFLTGCGVFAWQWIFVLAQPPVNQAQPASSPTPTPPVTPKELRDDELAISGRYSRFERMLTQMADILGRQDPERADLLRRAIGKGREDQVREDIEKVVELLSRGELGTATEKQQEVIASLEVLLKLLQSEDRRSSVERERERLNNLLRDIRGIAAEQKSTRAAAQNSESPSSAAPGQQKTLNQTDQVLKQMQEHDEQNAKAGSDTENGSSETDDGKKSGDDKEGTRPKAEKDGESSKNDADKSGEGNEGDGKDGKSKNPAEAEGKEPSGREPQDSKSGQKKSTGRDSGQKKSGDGKSQSGKPAGGEARKTPGREELQNAREEMERALEQLKEQEKEAALEHQDAALEHLQQAQEKLEEMLRQLREEEKEMMLASLEARFQRMLIVETQIHENTVTLAATPQKDWLDEYYGRCRELAQQQSELTVECAQTVNLLREDGTSVSILMAVEDIQADMGSVTAWLQESRVSDLTQSLQKDIIESLKQLIETTQNEMKEMKENKQNQEQEPNQEQKEGLVALMAEIRMLRNLQLRVNRRTKQVDLLLKSAPADETARLNEQVQELASRQRRLLESARELAKQAE